MRSPTVNRKQQRRAMWEAGKAAYVAANPTPYVGWHEYADLKRSQVEASLDGKSPGDWAKGTKDSRRRRFLLVPRVVADDTAKRCAVAPDAHESSIGDVLLGRLFDVRAQVLLSLDIVARCVPLFLLRNEFIQKLADRGFAPSGALLVDRRRLRFLLRFFDLDSTRAGIPRTVSPIHHEIRVTIRVSTVKAVRVRNEKAANHAACGSCEWARLDSNQRPRPYQGRALTN